MKPRAPFLFALAASLAVHMGVLAGPAWLLPALGDLFETTSPERIEAHLVAPAKPAASKARQARRPVRPRKRPPAPPPMPAATPDVAASADAAEDASASGEPGPAVEDPPPELAAAGAAAEEPSATPPAPVPAREIALPREVRIRYVVSMGEGGFVIGRAMHEWRHDGVTYALRSTAETTGLAALFKPAKVVHFSEGDVVDGGLRPREFHIERNGAPGDWARFDWQAGRIAMSGGPRDAVLEADTQDMVSMFCQLALVPLDKPSVSFFVATGKKVERYDFAVLGAERINTPLGEKPSVHLRTQRSGGDSTEIWLGTDMAARLPLKIRHVDRNGMVFDQVADSIEFDGNLEGAH